MNAWPGKPKYSEKTSPKTALSPTDPTWFEQGSSPSRRGGKPATNCLSYGTAVSVSMSKVAFRFDDSFSVSCRTMVLVPLLRKGRAVIYHTLNSLSLVSCNAFPHAGKQMNSTLPPPPICLSGNLSLASFESFVFLVETGLFKISYFSSFPFCSPSQVTNDRFLLVKIYCWSNKNLKLDRTCIFTKIVSLSSICHSILPNSEMTLRVTEVLEFVHHPRFKTTTQRFGNWICFHPQYSFRNVVF
jgi:hypothetical protein